MPLTEKQQHDMNNYMNFVQTFFFIISQFNFLLTLLCW